MYNFKSIIQIQKQEWEDIILRRINIGRPKVKINLAIKKLYWFFFLSKLYHFLSNSCNFECIFKNSHSPFKSYKSINFFQIL